MNLFYTPDFKDGFYQLPEAESKHVVRVLRMTAGDPVFLTDGLGNMIEASIIDSDPKRCVVKANRIIREYKKRPFYLHIAIAPTKNIERFEWFLEKSTEIGIDVITPLICSHSERTKINSDRLQKVIIAAMKQSLKAYLPKLDQPVTFKQFVEKPFEGDKFIAYCGESEPAELAEIYHKGAKALIMVGPEGDFSPEEVMSAKKQGFVPISLGKSRLRTETAGIVACHTINLMKG
jgi:16S rRNA (uracil1498-N3)-methyltransferase